MLSLKAIFAPKQYSIGDPVEMEDKARQLIEASRVLKNKVSEVHKASSDFEETVKEFLDCREAQHSKPKLRR